MEPNADRPMALAFVLDFGSCIAACSTTSGCIGVYWDPTDGWGSTYCGLLSDLWVPLIALGGSYVAYLLSYDIQNFWVLRLRELGVRVLWLLELQEAWWCVLGRLIGKWWRSYYFWCLMLSSSIVNNNLFCHPEYICIIVSATLEYRHRHFPFPPLALIFCCFNLSL